MGGKLFIIGAGVSHEDTKDEKLPLPLANDFFRSEYINEFWRYRIPSAPQFSDSSLSAILSHYFGVTIQEEKGKIVVSGSPNVEEVFSFLECFESVYGSSTYQRNLLSEAKRELTTYILDVISYAENPEDHDFWWIMAAGNIKKEKKLKKIRKDFKATKPFKTHSAIADILDKEDTVISFNWDLLFESVLGLDERHRHYFESRNNIMNPFYSSTKNPLEHVYLNLRDDTKGFFLKMHGSINFVNCSNVNCLRNQFPFVIDTFDAEVPELLQCNVCGSPVDIFIVPPHVNKSYKTNRFFRLQANLAAKKLNAANEIIAIGYSFPDFDFEASSLMRLSRLDPMPEADIENFLEKVTIVNPQTSDGLYVNKIKDLFGINHAKKVHGHSVELKLYGDIDSYIENELRRQ